MGVFSGDVETGFVVVFPFIAGSGIYAFLGFIFVFIAILLFMFGFTSTVESNDFQADYDEYQPSRKTSIKGGGGCSYWAYTHCFWFKLENSCYFDDFSNNNYHCYFFWF